MKIFCFTFFQHSTFFKHIFYGLQHFFPSFYSLHQFLRIYQSQFSTNNQTNKRIWHKICNNILMNLFITMERHSSNSLKKTCRSKCLLNVRDAHASCLCLWFIDQKDWGICIERWKYCSLEFWNYIFIKLINIVNFMSFNEEICFLEIQIVLWMRYLLSYKCS